MNKIFIVKNNIIPCDDLTIKPNTSIIHNYYFPCLLYTTLFYKRAKTIIINLSIILYIILSLLYLKRV